MSTILGEKTVKARKEHYCWYCNQLIPIGEKFSRRSGVCSDGFWNMKFHPECDNWALDNWDPDYWESHYQGDEFDRPPKGYISKKYSAIRVPSSQTS